MRAAMARADADVAGANAARLVIFGAPEAIVPVGDRTGEAGKKAGVEWEEPVDPPKPKRPTPEEIAAKRSRLDARLRGRRSSPTLMGLEQMGIGSAEARGWTAEQATAFEEQMVAHKYNLLAVSRMGRKKPPKTKCGPEEEMLQEGNEFLGKDKENDKAGDNRAIDDEKKDAAKDETGEPNGGGERAPGVELDVDDVPCLKCGETDGEPDFVLCDGCPKGGHYQCLGLPGVPEGDWFCADCVKDKETHLSPRKVPSADDFDEEPSDERLKGKTLHDMVDYYYNNWLTRPGTRDDDDDRSVCDDDDALPDKRKSIVSAKLARTISQEKELARLGIVDSPARKSAPKPKKADPKKDAERASKKVDELLRFTQRCARFPRKTAKTLAPSALSSKQALVRRWRRVMIVSDTGIDAGDEVRAELARKKLECVEATLTRSFENPQYPKADVAFSDDVA